MKSIKGTYHEVPRQIHRSQGIWQTWPVTVNRNSEHSLLIRDFQPWQLSSGIEYELCLTDTLKHVLFSTTV